MLEIVVVVKDSKNKCIKPCKYFPNKMVGSLLCRGCKYHKKHNKENSVVHCVYENKQK